MEMLCFLICLVSVYGGKYYFDFDSCVSGFILKSLCMERCPEGYLEFENYCHRKFEPVISLTKESVLDYENGLSFLKMVKESPKFFQIFSKYGAFFSESTSIEIPRIIKNSEFQILSFYLWIMKSGSLISDNRGFFEIELIENNMKFRVFDKIYFFEIPWSFYSNWIKIEIVFEQKSIFLTEVTLNITKDVSFIKNFKITQEIVGLKAWKIGKNTKNSFVGFLNHFLYFVDLVQTPDYEMQICYGNEANLKFCEDVECIEFLCSFKSRRLACLDPPSCWAIGKSCPNFYTIDSNNECIINVGNVGFYYVFDTPKSTFASIAGSYSILEPDSCSSILYSPGRGKYFNGYNSIYKTQSQHYYNLSPNYMMWVKIDSDNSGIWSKKDLFSIYTYNRQIRLNIHEEEKSLGDFDRGKWFFLEINLMFLHSSLTDLKSFINNKLSATDTFTITYNYDYPSTAYFGYAQGYYMLGWIYFMAYSPSYHAVSLGIFINLSRCDYWTGITAYCLDDCDPFYFNNTTSCQLCPLDCINCQRYNCGNCHDIQCSDCTRNSPGKCISCSDSYLANGYCFAQCPFMYHANGNNCSPNSGIFKLNFNSSGIYSSPDLMNITNVRGFGTFQENRGYFFYPDTYYEALSKFYIGPEYSMAIWLKMIEGTDCKIGFITDSFGFNFTHMKIVFKSPAVFIPLQVNISDWNIYVIKCYSFITYNSSIGPYYYDLFYNVPMFYNVFINNDLIYSYMYEDQSTKADRIISEFMISTDTYSSMIIYLFGYSVSYANSYMRFTSANCSSFSCMNCALTQYITSGFCPECKSYCGGCQINTPCRNCSYCCKILLQNCFIKCPLLFTDINDTCVKYDDVRLRFRLDSLKGIISDERSPPIMNLSSYTQGTYPNIDVTFDPIPGLQKGFYFGKDDREIFMLSSIQFQISPEFFIGIWLRPETYSEFLFKNSLFSAGLTIEGPKVDFFNVTSGQYQASSQNQVFIDSWSFVGISVEYSKGQTTAYIYTNSLMISNVLTTKLIQDDENWLFIGRGKNTYFKGWIYEIVFSAEYSDYSKVMLEIGQCNGCNCPSSLNKCLNPCGLDKFYAFESCNHCNGIPYCITSVKSTLCFDSRCNSCEDFKSCSNCSSNECSYTCSPTCGQCMGPTVYECIDCQRNFKQYGLVCVPECPLLYGLSSSSVCNPTTITKISVRFDTLASIAISSDKLLSFVDASGSPTVAFARGWYFSQLNCLNQSAFGIDSVLSFWIKPMSLGIILDKHSEYNLEIQINISNQNSILLKFQGVKDVYSLVFNTESYLLETWQSFVFSFSNSFLLYKIKLILQGKQQFENSVNSDHLITNSSNIVRIGPSDQKWWIFSFEYYKSSSNFLIGNLFGNCSKNCACPAPENFCLSECKLNELDDEYLCSQCNLSCATCRYNDSCKLCSDRLCNTCADINNESCSECVSNSMFNTSTKKCSCNPGFYQNGSFCFECIDRCADCTTMVYQCKNCKAGYIKSTEKLCMNYCSEGEILINGTCTSINSTIFDFKFTKNINLYKFNDVILYLGENNSTDPKNDTLQPWLLYERGLFFNNSQITLGSYLDPNLLRLSNSQSVSIYLNLLSCCGTIFDLTNQNLSFILLKSATIGDSLVLELAYSLSDLYINQTILNSFNISLQKWIRLSWSLSFNSPSLNLRIFIDQESVLSRSFENRVFNQPLSSAFYIGKSSSSYMIGYIYQLGFFSYPIDHKNLGVNPNLINCGPSKYLSNFKCSECNSSCTFGCFDNRSCKIHPDILCSYFEDLEESCKVCVPFTLNERPCKCQNNSNYSLESDSCKCQRNFNLLDGQCVVCTRWLNISDIQAYFTKNFIEIRVDFNISVFKVDCREIIQQSDLNKFGFGWKCETSEDSKSILYTLGEGFSISNESIGFLSEKIKGADPECGYSRVDLFIQIYFSVPLVKPRALIKAPKVVYYSCENLTIDGSVSTGSLKDKLYFKWELSGILELENYSLDYGNKSLLNFDSSELANGTLTVLLTVKNKFGLTDTAKVFITLSNSQGITPVFDSSVKYSCSVTRTCQFLISEVSTCIENPIFSFAWDLIDGAKFLNQTELNSFWERQVPGDSIIIQKNTFPPSRIVFVVTVIETESKVSGNGTLEILIEPESPVIIIENALGTISTLTDLSVNASGSFDPNGEELTYLWKCLGICNFTYTSDKSYLYISRDILNMKLFDAFLLNISSSVQVEGSSEKVVKTSQTIFSGDFVNRIVPKVSIIESYEKIQPKRFSRSKDSSLTAFIDDFDNEFEINWMLTVDDKNMVKSGAINPAVVIDMSLTVPGRTYKILFNVKDQTNSTSKFFYEFSANQPPKLGYFSINPSEGIEIKTKFDYKAIDWVDEEEDYPFAFSFGYIDGTKLSFLSDKSQQNTFRTEFIYLGNSLEAFCRIYDVLDDFIELTEKITVSIDPNFSSSNFLQEKMLTLNTSLLKAYPSILGNIINGILNRDSITGSMSSITLDELQSTFDFCIDFLSIYAMKMFPSPYVTDQMISLLDSLTRNSELSNPNNSISVNQVIISLLEKSIFANVPLSFFQGSAFLNIMENSGKLTIESSVNQTQLMSSVTTVIDQISKGVLLGMVENQKINLKSTQITIDITLTESKSMDGATFQSSSSSIASITLPEIISKNLPDNVGVCFVFLNIENKGETSSGAVVGFSLFTQSQANPLKVKLKSSTVSLTIPGFNLEYAKNWTCIYLDTEKEKWSTKGCNLVKINEDSVICQCNHLTFFSSGKTSSNFIPDSNIDQTVDISALKNINAINAIGFYFSLGIIIIYVFLMIFIVKKDRDDLKKQYETINNYYLDSIKKDEVSSQRFIDREEHTKEIPEVISKGFDQSTDRNRNNEVILHSDANLEQKEEPEQTKSKARIFLETHEFFSLFYLKDHLHSRALRCTLIFTVLIGNMFFIGLFYKGENKSGSTILESIKYYNIQDLLVMIYSSVIMSILVEIFPALIKNKPLNFKLTKSDNMKILKRNNIINIILISIYCAVMAYFCWSISLFAVNLPYKTSYMWILNTIVSIIVKFFITSIIILLIKIYIVSRILLWIEKKKKEKEVLQIEQNDQE